MKFTYPATTPHGISAQKFRVMAAVQLVAVNEVYVASNHLLTKN